MTFAANVTGENSAATAAENSAENPELGQAWDLASQARDLTVSNLWLQESKSILSCP